MGNPSSRVDVDDNVKAKDPFYMKAKSNVTPVYKICAWNFDGRRTMTKPLASYPVTITP